MLGLAVKPQKALNNSYAAGENMVLSFISELNRRGVIRVGVAYLTGGWLLLQVADIVLPIYGFEETFFAAMITILGIGFPVAIIFTWVFEFTSDGIRFDSRADEAPNASVQSDKIIDRVIILFLALALGLFAFDKFVLDPIRDAKRVEAAAQVAVSQALVELESRKPPSNSIAVLPFLDMSAKQDQAYFSFGLAEELLNLLAKIRELQVTSRTSAFAFHEQNLQTREIADALNVAYVLEGSVRIAGERIRVSTQLIDTINDVQVWSRIYNRNLDDIFAIQDEIAVEVVTALKIELVDAPQKAVETNPRNYALYLHALHAYERGSAATGRSTAEVATISTDVGTPESVLEALDFLQQAILVDSDFAPSWSLMSAAYLNDMEISKDERFQLADRAATRALELDPRDSRAHASLIQIALNGYRDFPAAVEVCESALSAGQVDPITVAWAVALARALNRLDEAVAIIEYAIARDPLVPRYYLQQSINYGHMGLYAESADSARQALVLDAEIGRAHFLVAGADFQLGNFDNIAEELSKEPEEFARLSGFAIMAFAAGDTATSDQLTEDLVAKYPNSIFVLLTHVFRNDESSALEWLEQNVLEANLAQLAETNAAPWYNGVRKHPRWQAALHLVGLSEQQLGEIEFNTGLL